MATHRRIAESGPDFYRTPAWATRALVNHESFEGKIWEPACGEGDMSEVLIQHGYEVLSSDFYDREYGHIGIDFTQITLENEVENIITNPPFALAEDFFYSAYLAASHKICLLLRLAFLEGQKRYRKIYAQTPPSRIWVFSERLSMYPAGEEDTVSGTTAYAWFVWDKHDKSYKTEMKWFPPGNKLK